MWRNWSRTKTTLFSLVKLTVRSNSISTIDSCLYCEGSNRAMNVNVSWNRIVNLLIVGSSNRKSKTLRSLADEGCVVSQQRLIWFGFLWIFLNCVSSWISLWFWRIWSWRFSFLWLKLFEGIQKCEGSWKHLLCFKSFRHWTWSLRF